MVYNLLRRMMVIARLYTQLMGQPFYERKEAKLNEKQRQPPLKKKKQSRLRLVQSKKLTSLFISHLLMGFTAISLFYIDTIKI